MALSRQDVQSYAEKNNLTANVIEFTELHYNYRFGAMQQRGKLMKLFAENNQVVLFFSNGDTHLSQSYADELIAKALLNDFDDLPDNENKLIVIECSNSHAHSIRRAFSERRQEMLDNEALDQEAHEQWRKDGYKGYFDDVKNQVTVETEKRLSRLNKSVRIISHGAYHIITQPE